MFNKNKIKNIADNGHDDDNDDHNVSTISSLTWCLELENYDKESITIGSLHTSIN